MCCNGAFAVIFKIILIKLFAIDFTPIRGNPRSIVQSSFRGSWDELGSAEGRLWPGGVLRDKADTSARVEIDFVMWRCCTRRATCMYVC